MAPRTRTVKQELEVVRLSARYRQVDIADMTGLSKGVVWRILRKYHVVLRFGQYDPHSRFEPWNRAAWGLVIEELYSHQRLNLAVVAERLGICQTTLVRRMNDLGIERRTPGDSQRGTKRKSFAWRPDLPLCDTPGCQTKVLLADQTRCATCRQREDRHAAPRAQTSR